MSDEELNELRKYRSEHDRIRALMNLDGVDTIEVAIGQLGIDRDQLKIRLSEAHKLLKELEWNGSLASILCPSCGRRKDLGHREDCRLKLFLEAHQ